MAQKPAALTVKWTHKVPIPQDNTPGAGKSALTKRRKSQPNLEKFRDVPVEIFWLICAHLKPMDLLNMARASQGFRAFLMKRNASSLWKRARSNVMGLPNCPPLLSEPAYANLIFSNYCHNCTKPTRSDGRIIWVFLARYCSTCKPLMLMEVPQHLLQGDMNLLQAMTMFDGRIGGGRYRTFVHRPQFEDFAHVIEHSSEDELPLLYQMLKDRASAIRLFAKEAIAWEEQLKEDRTARLEQIRQLRVQSAMERLRQVGWGKDLDDTESPLRAEAELSELGGLKAAKPLTDAGWREIEEQAIAVMEKRKTARLRRERVSVLKARITTLKNAWTPLKGSNGPVPRFRDLVSLPEIRAIADARGDEPLSAAVIASTQRSLPSLVTRFLKGRRVYFEVLVRKQCTIPRNVDPFFLAVGSYYGCTRCRSTILYPDVLVHNCSTLVHFFVSRGQDLYEQAANEVFMQHSISEGQEHRQDFSTSVKHIIPIIRAFGRDPLTATIEELDASPLRVYCPVSVCAAEDPNVVVVMNWRAAVDHVFSREISFYGGEPSRKITDKHPFVLIPERLSVHILELESKFQDTARGEQEPSRACSCNRCPVVNPDKTQVMQHFRQTHPRRQNSWNQHWWPMAQRPGLPHHIYLVNHGSALKKTTRALYQSHLQSGSAMRCKIQDLLAN